MSREPVMFREPVMSRFSVIAALSLSIASLAACGTDTAAPAIRNFDRPTDMAFACFGDLRVDDTVITSAQPIGSCTAHQRGEAPEGQEGLVPPEFFGFVLQPERGTVAVVNVRALGVQDNDSLTPGLNDIPVGTLPVGMTEDASGCHVMVANAGSCDLAAVNVTSAIDPGQITEVNRLTVTTPTGELLLARPRSITSGPQIEDVGQVCPISAQGTVYLSYPECHLVAAVDAASGQVQSGLVFSSDGSVALATDADYAACPVQCGDSVGNLAHGVEAEIIEERPVAMEISPDGSKLYVTSESSPFFTIVDLDASGLPTATVRRVRVEGSVGLLKFAVSGRIDMGGDLRGGEVNMPVGEFQFAYAIATDSTIRVLDLDAGVECDTQVDPRFLADVTDYAFLSCMPVGDVRTPPRRFGARGPGIQLPGSIQHGSNGLATLALPLDVAITNVAAPGDLGATSDPNQMVGTFAFATAATGQVFVINVDDDHYADHEDPADPLRVSMPLALPHQLRDDVTERDKPSPDCLNLSAQRNELGARVMAAPRQIVNPAVIATNKLHELPFLQGLRCEGEDGLGNLISTIISELSIAASADVRERAFPDLRVVENQEWFITWEGSLAGDNLFVNIDGPPIRKGVVARDGNRALLQDASEPFCSIGVEPFDIAALVGCDPLANNAQCGVAEKCYVHPDSTTAVSSGVCLPADRVDELSGQCRDFLISRRRYSVSTTAKGELELIERRRMLRTTPLDGCASAAQCVELADAQRLLGDGAHPLEADLEDPAREFSWACEADPSREPGVDRCVMTCDSNEECENGFSCSEQRCVEARLPPEQCLASVQRYQLIAGEAFAVLGADDGFLHSIVADPVTGACVQPPDAHPLAVGRIPLRAPACDEDGDPYTGPNPCSTTVPHTEEFVPYVVEGEACVARQAEIRTREAPAIRFANPALTFHMVDTETTGDLECRNDQAGMGPSIGTPYAGYQMILDIGGGFLPKTVPELLAALPIRIVTGPAGNLWVLDQGDASSLTRGRIFRFNPTKPAGFELVVIL